jgi:tRNA (Thr-GGU) A37 N-methylase
MRHGGDPLKVQPRGDESLPLTGVFSTRSPDWPNPLGLHRVTVREIVGNRIRIGPIEAIHGTPVADIKPVLRNLQIHEQPCKKVLLCHCLILPQSYTNA